MIRILTVDIDGQSKAKWTYLCNLSCLKNLDMIIMTEHQLSSTFRPVEIVESGWSIQQVASVQKRRSRQHENRGGVAILKRDEAGLHVNQTRVIDGSSASPHQAVSEKISSDNLAHPFHITGMYMNPSQGMVEEFCQTLARQQKLPPNEPLIYAGDNNSYVGEEIEAHLSSQEISKLPERVGDDKHPPELPQIPFLDSDRPSSKHRGRVFLKMNSPYYPKRPIRTENPTHLVHVATKRKSLHNQLPHHFKRTLSPSKIMHCRSSVITQIPIDPQATHGSQPNPPPHCHAYRTQQPCENTYNSARLKYNKNSKLLWRENQRKEQSA